MGEKRMILLGLGMGMMIFLLTFYQPLVAAPPTGEVKTVGPGFGNQTPAPHLEMNASNDWMQLLYDHLLGTTPDGKFSPDLGLANKWEMSPDGLTWTFHIKKGVKFHDGVELTAKDVKFSIELLALPESVSSNTSFVRKDVKSIEIKDPYTLIIHCKQPSIFLNSLFSNLEIPSGMVVPKDYYERVGKDAFMKRPIGSGPYKWHSQEVGSFIKLEATDKHWRDGVPKYKYMTYLIIPEESTRIAMLKTGEADIARIGRDSVRDAQNAGLNVMIKQNGSVVYFQPNMQWTSPVFSDLRFRKALNLAIDKESIIKNIFSGFAKPMATYPGSNIFVIGGDPNLKPYPYDPQEARRLIKEGGWEGHEFTLMSYARPGCPEFPLVVEAIAGYWEKIGLKPKIRMSEWTVWRQAWNERKTQNTVHGSDSTTNPEISTLILNMGEKLYFKNSRSAVNVPEVNDRFARIDKSMDITEISKLLAEIYRIEYDLYLTVAVCEIPDMIATTKRIPKWDPGFRRNDRNYYDLIKQR